MHLVKKINLTVIAVLCSTAIFSQTLFSLSTDLSAFKSLKKGQRYWAAAHTTILNFHITPKDGIYVWFGYSVGGKFKNDLVADAKSVVTIPQQISYVNTSIMRLKEISIGWKKYFKGVPDDEATWNLYGTAGFGLMFGRVTNEHSVDIDTSQYNVPVQSGLGKFKRLTLDLGLGAELALGGDFYLYNEVRAWIPTPGYPSKYILVNDHAPLVGLFSVGLRLLF